MKFADDTKLLRKTKDIGDKQNLQDDIDTFVRWSEKWQEMRETILSKTVKEKYLGVSMNGT